MVWQSRTHRFLENDGYDIRNFGSETGNIRSTVPNTEFYFRECLTWSKVSCGSIAFRYRPCGSILDVAGACLYGGNQNYSLGLLNSVVSAYLLEVLAPTLNFEGGQINSIPIVEHKPFMHVVENLVSQNINLSREDWNTVETSWDFKRHPLIQPPPPAGGTPFAHEGGVSEADGGCAPSPPPARPYNIMLKPFAREMRKKATKWENHLWYDFMRDFRPRFTRQRIVGNYILDFFCGSVKLAVELDGSRRYEHDAMECDYARTAFLNNFGIEAIRSPNNEIDNSFDAVCGAIADRVSKRREDRDANPDSR